MIKTTVSRAAIKVTDDLEHRLILDILDMSDLVLDSSNPPRKAVMPHHTLYDIPLSAKSVRYLEVRSFPDILDAVNTYRLNLVGEKIMMSVHPYLRLQLYIDNKSIKSELKRRRQFSK